MSNFEQKRQRRIERLERLAVLYKQQADQMHKSARGMAEMIPFGQPILIGHHSERRDRNYRARIMRRFEKSFELQDKAAYYARRAASAQANRTIFSDDPEAVFKLEEKAAKLEKCQETMKKANAIIRKHNLEDAAEREKCVAALVTACQVKEESARRWIVADYAGRYGFPSYALSNNNAEIRRCKLRIKQLQKRQERETTERTTETEAGAVRIVENAEENRLQLFFPGKPAEVVRSLLKSYGFRWSPFNGCWQAYLNETAKYRVENVILPKLKEAANV